MWNIAQIISSIEISSLMNKKLETKKDKMLNFYVLFLANKCGLWLCVYNTIFCKNIKDSKKCVTNTYKFITLSMNALQKASNVLQIKACNKANNCINDFMIAVKETCNLQI